MSCVLDAWLNFYSFFIFFSILFFCNCRCCCCLLIFLEFIFSVFLLRSITIFHFIKLDVFLLVRFSYLFDFVVAFRTFFSSFSAILTMLLNGYVSLCLYNICISFCTAYAIIFQNEEIASIEKSKKRIFKMEIEKKKERKRS